MPIQIKGDDDIQDEILLKSFYGHSLVISGAGGFIGTHIVRALLYLNKTHDAKITVIALVRNEDKARGKFIDYRNDPYFSIHAQDVCEPFSIEKNVDFIIHAASHASPRYYLVDPIGTMRPNVLGTINLLEIAKEKKITSFLYISSGEIYGTFSDDMKSIVESDSGYIDPLSVRSCYAESKRMGENICVSYFHQFGVPIKIVRPFHVYGPGMAMDDGRVQADFVSNVVKGEDIVMKGDGKSYRTFCYISDAVRAFFTVLLKGTNGEAYNVGNNIAEIQISNLAKLLAHRVSRKKIRVIRKGRKKDEHYRESPIKRCRPNIEKIMKLGWKPRYSLDEGFRRTIESYFLRSV